MTISFNGISSIKKYNYSLEEIMGALKRWHKFHVGRVENGYWDC